MEFSSLSNILADFDSKVLNEMKLKFKIHFKCFELILENEENFLINY